MKPFKDTFFGRLLWKAGDTLKGKTRVGKALDFVGEAIPLPNPIRAAQALARNEKVEQLKRDPNAVKAASDINLDLNDLIDDTPDWFRMGLVSAIVVGVFILIYLGVIDAEFLINFFGL